MYVDCRFQEKKASLQKLSRMSHEYKKIQTPISQMLCGLWKSIDRTFSLWMHNNIYTAVKKINRITYFGYYLHSIFLWNLLNSLKMFPFVIKFNFEMNFDQRRMEWFYQVLIFKMKFFIQKAKKKLFVSKKYMFYDSIFSQNIL